MDINETEKLLEESAKNVKLRDFSEVWAEIKDEIEPAPKIRFYQKKWFAPLLAACFSLIFAIVLPIYFLFPSTTPDEVYYQDKLVSIEVDANTFNNELSNSTMTHVSFAGYIHSACSLYKTEDDKIKGGAVDLYDNLTTPTEIIKINFYDASVEFSDDEKTEDYRETYTKDGLSVEYNIGERFPEYNIYEYDIKASYNNVNYFIEYMGTAENPIEFFNSFFK